MDPIALTISVIEIGLKVKDSVDTLSRRRSRAKELASDVVVNLLRIAEFCGQNNLTLSKSTALGPLCHSLDVLQRDLYRIHQQCKAHEPGRGNATHRRLTSTFKLWMNSDEIEEDLVRIKERIQTSMNCILVLSCARTEVGIMRLEETVLANAHETRSCIQQLDRVFTQQLLHRDPGLQAFDHSRSEVDDIDIQYICLKSMKLIDTISVSTFATSGTNTFKGLRLPLFGALLETKVHHALFAIADLQSRARSDILPITSIVGYALYLMNTCAGLGALDVGLNILAAVESCIRRTLRLGTLRLRLPHHIEDEEEDDFDSLEAIVSLWIAATLAYLSEQPPADHICDEEVILKQTFHALQFSRDRLKRRISHLTFHRVQFLHKLIPIIRYHAFRGQVKDCFGYCSEALELIQACDSPTTREITDLVDVGVLQSHAQVLWYLSRAQQRTYDYASAYETGMKCITSIKALSNIRGSLLPGGFSCFPEILQDLQQDMPTWTSVVRNPGIRRTSFIEDDIDEDDVDDGSTRQIEWGIAL